MEPVPGGEEKAKVSELTLDQWEAEARKRLALEIEEYSTHLITDEERDERKREAESIRNGENISSSMAQDALAHIFSDMVKDGLATFGSDEMENYFAFMKRFTDKIRFHPSDKATARDLDKKERSLYEKEN